MCEYEGKRMTVGADAEFLPVLERILMGTKLQWNSKAFL